MKRKDKQGYTGFDMGSLKGDQSAVSYIMGTSENPYEMKVTMGFLEVDKRPVMFPGLNRPRRDVERQTFIDGALNVEMTDEELEGSMSEVLNETFRVRTEDNEPDG